MERSDISYVKFARNNGHKSLQIIFIFLSFLRAQTPRVDFVRIHFKENRPKNISIIYGFPCLIFVNPTFLKIEGLIGINLEFFRINYSLFTQFPKCPR